MDMTPTGRNTSGAEATDTPPTGRTGLWRLALIITCSVMLTEVAIMWVFTLPFMAGFSQLQLILLDVPLLGGVLSPIIYFFLLAPLREKTIREQKEAQSLRDELTGLPSRGLFMELVGHEVRRGTRNGWSTVLIVLNPARLSEINQIFGYGFGDKVLKELAQRLGALLRSSDIIARVSGDEFGLLLQQVEKKDVALMVRKIAATLDTVFQIEGISVDVGVTMGIAVFPHHGTDASLLLRRARIALSTAKGNLDPYAIFEQEYESLAEDRIKLFGDIRQAIMQDEFELHYQPIIDLATSKVVSAEALLRWSKGAPQLLSRFIPFAEQVGAITDITRWVLQRAIRQVSEWKDRGLLLNVSVNVSVRDILNDKQIKYLLRLCDEYDVDPSLITIEITESSIMRQPEYAIAVLAGLREKGFLVAIDDFGTGYSSLSYLREMPASELKIDRSFIRYLGARESDERLVGLIVDIGSTLGLNVVAEGIESEALLEKVRDLGCDRGQGYQITPPLPPEEFESWYRRWTGEPV